MIVKNFPIIAVHLENRELMLTISGLLEPTCKGNLIWTSLICRSWKTWISDMPACRNNQSLIADTYETLPNVDEFANRADLGSFAKTPTNVLFVSSSHLQFFAPDRKTGTNISHRARRLLTRHLLSCLVCIKVRAHLQSSPLMNNEASTKQLLTELKDKTHKMIDVLTNNWLYLSQKVDVNFPTVINRICWKQTNSKPDIEQDQS
eukprot:767619-Hanusia_phi.AAC.1